MAVGSSVRPTRGGAEGVSVNDVISETTTWAEACEMSGVGHGAGVLAGAARLVLWHLLQPSVYLVALGVYWPDLGWWSRLLGGIVGAREAAYVALCLVGLWANPAYLLVDDSDEMADGVLELLDELEEFWPVFGALKVRCEEVVAFWKLVVAASGGGGGAAGADAGGGGGGDAPVAGTMGFRMAQVDDD